MRRSLLLLTLLASCGGAAPADDDTAGTRPVAEPCTPPDHGAPVPLRRLTRTQIERTLAALTDVVTPVPVSDEVLIGYRANTSASIDASTARTVLLATEGLAAAYAGPASEGCEVDTCAEVVLDLAEPRLFRRPLTAEQRAPYRAVYEAGVAEGGKEEGVRWLLEAMFQSPRMLYFIEETTPDGDLDGYSLAQRLSYALWSSPPDEELLAAAASGELHTDEGLRRQAVRMMEDSRFVWGLNEFVVQWLGLDDLDDPTERPDLFALPEGTREAMRREPVLFFADQVASGGGVEDLLTETHVPMEPMLAEIYGDDLLGASGGLTALDPTRRAGILTLPGVLAAHSHARQTSPTRRGKTVLEQLLCDPPPPPPSDVTPELPPETEGGTTRERLAAHLDNPACSSCHASMDGIGFTYEKLDELGRTRALDAGRPIDTSASFFISGYRVDVDGAVDMADVLSVEPDVAECVARHWGRYSLGILEDDDGACVAEEMGAVASGPDGLKEMLLHHITSPWFRKPAPAGEES